MLAFLSETQRIKIALNGAKPPIWRRVLIADSASLPQLHRVIQIAMGWDDSHLHQFRAGDRCYGRPDPEYDSADTLDERRYKLGQLLKNEKDSIIYDYDNDNQRKR